jgi:hypothetical protein
VTDSFDPTRVEADVRRWLERAVIGLNLCPFAKAVYARNQVRIVVSDASTERALLEELGEEMALLRDTPAEQVDTILLVHPQVLGDFLDYNDFLDDADALVGDPVSLVHLPARHRCRRHRGAGAGLGRHRRSAGVRRGRRGPDRAPRRSVRCRFLRDDA